MCYWDTRVREIVWTANAVWPDLANFWHFCSFGQNFEPTLVQCFTLLGKFSLWQMAKYLTSGHTGFEWLYRSVGLVWWCGANKSERGICVFKHFVSFGCACHGKREKESVEGWFLKHNFPSTTTTTTTNVCSNVFTCPTCSATPASRDQYYIGTANMHFGDCKWRKSWNLEV